jgi:N-acetyl-anhydromuramyl-L-alanine amidase AmpD
MTGDDVVAWQSVVGAKPDGDFGEQTETLTKMWQQAKGLKPDGVVGQITRAAAANASTLPPTPLPDVSAKPAIFIPAKNFTRGRYGAAITAVIIHSMESQEKPGTARNVAHWFAGATAPKASAHYNVDADEIVQCVRESDMAWGAPGANRQGVHIEHAGRASQTADQWGDAFSAAMLRRSAALVADICRRNNIPIKRIGPDELKSGARGICGHDTVSKAFPVKGAHTDPGVGFPWAKYIAMVIDADGMGGKTPVSA